MGWGRMLVRGKIDEEPGVIYTATDATKATTPEPGMLRQVLAYNPHLMLVRHTFEKGWKGARHSHPHHQMVYVDAGAYPSFRPRAKAGRCTPVTASWSTAA